MNIGHCAILFLVLLFVGCDSNDNVPLPEVVVAPVNVSGGAVKGPLADADVVISRVDLTAPDLKGAQVATGTTGADAAFVDIELPATETGLLLVEVVANTDTIDITTGEAPLMMSMVSILTLTDIEAGRVYATPLTTMAVKLARRNADISTGGYAGNEDGQITSTELSAALVVASSQVISTVGFGLPVGTNLFTSAPLLNDDTDTDEKQTAVLQYRQAIEGLSAVIALAADRAAANNPNTGATPDLLLAALAEDLADGTIDGRNAGTDVAELIDVGDIAAVVTTDPAELLVPGTSIALGNIAQVIADETTSTGIGINTDRVRSGALQAPFGRVLLRPDSDGDGTVDNDDAFPADPGESADLDGDGVGDNSDTDVDGDGVDDSDDAFPRNPNESVDTDGDGIGNNADADDDGDGVDDSADDLPLDDQESVDTDGDGIGNNADTDDDGDGVPDSDDAFPLLGDESVDTDGDGIGNNADTDDDDDGVNDVDDALPLDAESSEAASSMIGSAGGTVTSSDGRLVLEIPAGALASDHQITIGQIGDEIVDANLGENHSVDQLYAMGPEGLVFDIPATVSYNLPTDSPAGARFFFSLRNGQASASTDNEFDQQTGKLTASIGHFSRLGIFNTGISIKVQGAAAKPDPLIWEYSLEGMQSGFDLPPELFVFTQGWNPNESTFSVQPEIVSGEAFFTQPEHKTELYVSSQATFTTSETGRIEAFCTDLSADGLSGEIAFGVAYKDFVPTAWGSWTEGGNGVVRVKAPALCRTSDAVTEPWVIGMDSGIDRVNPAGAPPYLEVGCTGQSYVATARESTVFVSEDGRCTETLNFPGTEQGNFGAVLLQDGGNEAVLSHGPFGTTVGVPEDGFFAKFFGELFGGPKATTDAVNGKQEDGSPDFSTAYTVNDGVLYQYVLDAAEVAVRQVVTDPRTEGKSFVSFSAIDDKTGVAVTRDTPSEAFLIDLSTGAMSPLTEVGDGALTVRCEDTPSGRAACAVSAYDSKEAHVLFLTISREFIQKVIFDNISTASFSTRVNSAGDFVFANMNDTNDKGEVRAISPFTVGLTAFTEFFLTEIGLPQLNLTATIGLGITLLPPSDANPDGAILGTARDGDEGFVWSIPASNDQLQNFLGSSTGFHYYF